MIYLVSNNQQLFKSSLYTSISPEEALQLLWELDDIALDTETEGLDVFSDALLLTQLGNKDIQVVVDCLTVDINLFKPLLESNKQFLLWNAQFDLEFFYHKRILINNVYDGFLAEKILYLGYEHLHEYSLKAAGKYYLDIDLDKSLRGTITTLGITDATIVYAANDVKYLHDIRDKQLEDAKKKDVVNAIIFENEFVKCLTYIKYCGIKLDEQKWSNKIERDSTELQKAQQALDNWLIDYVLTKRPPSYYSIDTTWLNDYTYAIEKSKLPKNAVRCPEKDYARVKVWKVDNKSDYIYQNLQGDLFSDFDTDWKCGINWNSSQQVIPLFEELGIDCTTIDKKTKKSKKSIEASVIKPQKHKSEIIPLYLRYQTFQKLCSTYGENWLKAINPVSKRLRTNFFQLGAKSGRLSSGGKPYNINFQNLPKDELTRSCFVAEEGNVFISADYCGQESALLASIANDKAMLEELTIGSKDIHSLVAKMSYPEIIKNCPVEQIKEKFPKQRQDSKRIEFAINYGGNALTISSNQGIPLHEAQTIYNNYMKGFPGVANYQKQQRAFVLNNGYILINENTGHKSFIPNFEKITQFREVSSQPDFWNNYNRAKATNSNPELIRYVREYTKFKSVIEKQAINYKIQGNGALCFKLASIKLFNYLKNNNLLFIVKYCIPVHDEINLECPEELGDEIAQVLVKCMEAGAAPFCTRMKLSADVHIGKHWIH